MDEDDEVIQEFLVEGREGLDQLDQELVALEDDPSNPDRLASIFRTIHSLKGTSGFLGYAKLESISHVGENLLSNMRDGVLELNQPITDALLNLVDASREILDNIDENGEEGDGNYDGLVATLAELANSSNQVGAVEALDAKAEHHVTHSGAPNAMADDAASQPLILNQPTPSGNALLPATPQENVEEPAVLSQGPLHAASPLSEAEDAEEEQEKEIPKIPKTLPPVGEADDEPQDEEAEEAKVSEAGDDDAEEAQASDSGPDDETEDNEDLDEENAASEAVSESSSDDASDDSPAEEAVASQQEVQAPAAAIPPPAPEVPSAPAAANDAQAEAPAAAAPVAPAPVAPAPSPAPVAKAPTPVAAPAPPEPAAIVETPKPAPVAKRATPKPSRAKDKSSAEVTIRVDVSLLDRLMNLVGELVLSRNQILQVSSRTEDSAFLATTQRLNHITTELQEGLMKTRMQPIKSVWAKFPRVVRDLAKMCEKDVRIEMEGEDTELDRTIIEAIKDPMTHIVRNSVDHGVESPEERKTRGKPAQGRLTLRAYHEGGKVNIEISDDGKGLDVKRIREKAIEKEVVSAGELARMTEREAMQLIFAPGFSTAAAVTQVSGRGVGMDVVKTNIERIGGTIDLSSRVNLGTTIKIKIPLTLAIIPALVVDCAGDSYAIPQVSLLELVRFEKEQVKSGVETVHGAPVCRLRGNLLPLVYLHEVLGVDPVPPEDEAVNIIVLQADDRHFGLVVDHVSDTEEIVVKPLGKELKSVSIFAGATIMGDGRVALILDVLGVAQAGQLASQERDRRLRHVGAADRAASKKYTMLVFRINEHERGAVPLKTVARLEEVPKERIEQSGGDEVVQYRGEIMPIIRISNALGRPARPCAEVEQVLVYQRRKRSIGVIVEAIEDVVEERLDIHRPVMRTGVKGQAVLQGKVTELIDLPELIESVHPGFFDADAAE